MIEFLGRDVEMVVSTATTESRRRTLSQAVAGQRLLNQMLLSTTQRARDRSSPLK